MSPSDSKAQYRPIIERIFKEKFKRGATEIDFVRGDIARVAERLHIQLPKNVGDLVYSFRHRTALPESITRTAPKGKGWIIRGVGQSKYRFVLVSGESRIRPDSLLAVVKIADSTPGIISKYALSDEQALLAKVRYNRLVDTFIGVTCYSLQSHLRTTVKGIGQVETDEIYVGVDKRGANYVLTVQAKGGSDELGIVQIEQDLALAEEKFPDLERVAIGAQFLAQDVIALFAFRRMEDSSIAKVSERHYRLVPPEEIDEADLKEYRSLPE